MWRCSRAPRRTVSPCVSAGVILTASSEYALGLGRRLFWPPTMLTHVRCHLVFCKQGIPSAASAASTYDGAVLTISLVDVHGLPRLRTYQGGSRLSTCTVRIDSPESASGVITSSPHAIERSSPEDALALPSSQRPCRAMRSRRGLDSRHSSSYTKSVAPHSLGRNETSRKDSRGLG